MIENWKHAWKMLSVWVFALAGSLAGLEQFLPAFEGKIPPGVYAALMILGIVARLIRQPTLEAPESVVEELRRVKAIAKKGGLISLVLLALGCTVPLEKARTAGLSERTTGAGKDPTPYCQKLDRARANWGAVAKGAAVASGASGISTIPLDEDHETIAASTAAGLAVVGGVAFYMSEQKASQWARDCSER